MNSITLRHAAIACLFVTVACSDTRETPVAHDRDAEQTLVSFRVHADLWQVSSTARSKIGSGSFEAKTVLLPAASTLAALRNGDRSGPQIRVRHFKDARGVLHSIGAVLDPSGKPPQFVYAFEDGQIRAVISAKHEMHAGRWLKVNSRVTTFDSGGVPSLQADLGREAQHTATAGTGTKAPTDVLRRLANFVLPAELHASAVEEGACISEWLTYSAAAFALASASAALTAAVATCASSGACAAVEKATGVWLTTLAAWNLALDRLNACLIRSWINETNSTSGGNAPGNDFGSPTSDLEEEIARTAKTVEEFIADAIATGNYYCTDSGDYCVYFAS